MFVVSGVLTTALNYLKNRPYFIVELLDEHWFPQLLSFRLPLTNTMNLSVNCPLSFPHAFSESKHNHTHIIVNLGAFWVDFSDFLNPLSDFVTENNWRQCSPSFFCQQCNSYSPPLAHRQSLCECVDRQEDAEGVSSWEGWGVCKKKKDKLKYVFKNHISYRF